MKITKFITLDYHSQIEQLLNKKSLFDQIVTKNNCSNRSNDSRILNDLYDGKVYQDAVKQKPNNTQYISINFSIWPLLGTIAEFDQQSRENFKNMIVLGIFFN